MPLKVRRVVTGHDSEGRAVVLSDGPPPQCGVDPEVNVGIAELWATSEFPASNKGNQEAVPDPLPIAPGTRGTVFRIVEFPPEQEEVANTEAVQTYLRNQGSVTPERPRHPGMHKTHTVDYAVVVSGRVDLLLDEEEVTLQAGDTVVQRGTFHAWANRYAEPCLVAFILVAADSTT